MKKIFNIILIIALIMLYGCATGIGPKIDHTDIFAKSAATNKMYGRIALTGGTSSVDNILYADLSDNDMCMVITTGNLFYLYRFESSSTADESSPDVITPDDAGVNNGRWLIIESTNYISTLSSNAQDQIDLKAPIANAAFTGTFQVPSLRGTPLSVVPLSPIDGVEYWFLNSSDGGADDPSDITGTVPYKTLYDSTTSKYHALYDYDANVLTNKVQTRSPVAGSTTAFATLCTEGCLYGGTYFVTSDNGDLPLPILLEGMNFEIITVGTIEVVADPQNADESLVDGVPNAAGHSLTNTSTAGDWAKFKYMPAIAGLTVPGWFVQTNGWTQE